MDEEIIAVKARKTRWRYQAGMIDYKQAKTELADYIAFYNRKSKEAAAKYGVQPRKLRVGEFLRFKEL